MTCVAFSIKFTKTNQKFAENSEFCEKKSLLLVNYSLRSLQVLRNRLVIAGDEVRDVLDQLRTQPRLDVRREPPVEDAEEALARADRQNFSNVLLVFGCIGTDLCK